MAETNTSTPMESDATPTPTSASTPMEVDPTVEKKEEKDEELEEQDLTDEKNGGVIKKIITKGEGWKTPKKGADVVVHYVGKLTNGTQFDSSRDRNEPFTFALGKGQVIKGWDIGVASMKKGEKATLTIKSEYGYGAGGSPPKIPGGATLVFEVELISWQDEVDVTKDGGVLKRVEKEGDGWETPKEDSLVTVDLIARIDEKVVQEWKDFKFTLGAEEVITGLEKTVEGMKKGELAFARIQPNYAYGEKGNPSLNIPPNARLDYEITLKDFTKEKSAWEMETAEKFEWCEKSKNEGNELYKASKFSRAAKKYKKALSFVESDYSMSDDEKTKAKQMKLPCLLNIAACKLKEKAWKDVIENANKALEIDAKNVKGLFRRGTAQLELDEWDAARKDFDAALEIDPKNVEVKKEKARLQHKIATQNKRDKARFKNMFERIAKIEEKEEKEEGAKVEEVKVDAKSDSTEEKKEAD